MTTREFDRIQGNYERRWERVFFAYLKKEYNRTARTYPMPYEPDVEELERIFKRLYMGIVIPHAANIHKEEIEPVEGQKDIIDTLVGIMAPNRSGSGLISLWRDLLGQFLQVRVAQRITSITNTTRKRITTIIERSIEEGLGAEEISREISQQAGGNINVHRARAIARTETVTAMNQGTYMAANSSRFQMEKSWDATLDGRTRSAHRDADIHGRWIPFDQPFYLQNPQTGTLESAMHPGDNSLSAGNLINCRCSMLTRHRRDANGRLIPKM